MTDEERKERLKELAHKMGGRIKDETAPDYMQAYAHAIHKIERETGILITKDFPAMKFFNLLDFCVHCEEEKEHQENEMNRRR